jgi:hypothetical protein
MRGLVLAGLVLAAFSPGRAALQLLVAQLPPAGWSCWQVRS